MEKSRKKIKINMTSDFNISQLFRINLQAEEVQ